MRSESQEDEGDLQRDLLATLQSLGEIYLRLQNFQEATSYMERHYELAVQMQDEVEQQRSSTQLGRAYFESFTSRGDAAAAAAGADIEASLEQQAASMETLKSARKYFQLSLRLAKGLHEGGDGMGGAGARAGGNGRARGARAGRSGGGSGWRSSGGNRRFAQELADAYNNVGLLFEEVESYKEAVNCFDRGLEVCDDEEIGSIDETRTRLHNSLGRVFTKSCQWEQARKHIDMDVKICERLNNAVGCAKAWVNKGDFCFKKEEYDEAERAFKRARDILQQVEDEAALLATCESNLETVAEAKRQKERCEHLWAQHRKTQRLLERAGSSEEKQKQIAEDRRILKELVETADGAQARLTTWDVSELVASVAASSCLFYLILHLHLRPHVHLHVHVHLHLHLHLHLHVHLHVHLRLHPHLHVHLRLHPHLHVHLRLHPHLHVHLRLHPHLHVHLRLHLQRLKAAEEYVRLGDRAADTLLQGLLPSPLSAPPPHAASPLLQRLKAAEEYVRLGDRAADTLLQCEAAEAMAEACYNLNDQGKAWRWYHDSLGLNRRLKIKEVCPYGWKGRGRCKGGVSLVL
ncbi:unnamed protein product [Closterium sp. Yama58-4]|nr:unnamed protein product [Closterium sp. Yama58-4]